MVKDITSLLPRQGGQGGSRGRSGTETPQIAASTPHPSPGQDWLPSCRGNQQLWQGLSDTHQPSMVLDSSQQRPVPGLGSHHAFWIWKDHRSLWLSECRSPEVFFFFLNKKLEATEGGQRDDKPRHSVTVPAQKCEGAQSLLSSERAGP